MIVELTLLPIAMIVVFLRLWVRISWLKKSWYDDYLMIVAMIFSIGMSSPPWLPSPLIMTDSSHRNHRYCHHGISAVWVGPPCLGP
jgi:hypothetical protein